ncbi:hypothetical protein B5807_08384 [Epicoccum nigrum]|uniref:Uncharacterized protein n=1 Tax=Epicoccum nigrum TaxID=105696 RepID=A0A1Y2LQW6_EPING|nr:hypothetical protein B5807_08384 [Epicoccum nigrum]
MVCRLVIPPSTLFKHTKPHQAQPQAARPFTHPAYHRPFEPNKHIQPSGLRELSQNEAVGEAKPRLGEGSLQREKRLAGVVVRRSCCRMCLQVGRWKRLNGWAVSLHGFGGMAISYYEMRCLAMCHVDVIWSGGLIDQPCQRSRGPVFHSPCRALFGSIQHLATGFCRCEVDQTLFGIGFLTARPGEAYQACNRTQAQSDPASSFKMLSQAALSSWTPATFRHLSRILETSSHSFAASSSCSWSIRSRRRLGVPSTHLTVSCCFRFFAVSSSSVESPCTCISMPRPSGLFWRFCMEDEREAAVSAMCAMAGPSVWVVGASGSMFPRMRRMVLVAESSLE